MRVFLWLTALSLFMVINQSQAAISYLERPIGPGGMCGPGGPGGMCGPGGPGMMPGPIGGPGMMPPPCLPPIPVQMFMVPGGLVRMNYGVGPSITSRILDIPMLRQQLLMRGFPPPLVNQHLATIAMPAMVPVPCPIPQIVLATQAIMFEFGSFAPPVVY